MSAGDDKTIDNRSPKGRRYARVALIVAWKHRTVSRAHLSAVRQET